MAQQFSLPQERVSEELDGEGLGGWQVGWLQGPCSGALVRASHSLILDPTWEQAGRGGDQAGWRARVAITQLLEEEAMLPLLHSPPPPGSCGGRMGMGRLLRSWGLTLQTAVCPAGVGVSIGSAVHTQLRSAVYPLLASVGSLGQGELKLLLDSVEPSRCPPGAVPPAPSPGFPEPPLPHLYFPIAVPQDPAPSPGLTYPGQFPL